jgi:hypothetical protein
MKRMRLDKLVRVSYIVLGLLAIVGGFCTFFSALGIDLQSIVMRQIGSMRSK